MGVFASLCRFSWAFMMAQQNRTHSTREIFVGSLRKTFGHLSDTSKKAERTSAVSPEHYIHNKVFPASISSRIVCSTVVRAAGFCFELAVFVFVRGGRIRFYSPYSIFH